MGDDRNRLLARGGAGPGPVLGRLRRRVPRSARWTARLRVHAAAARCAQFEPARCRHRRLGRSGRGRGARRQLPVRRAPGCGEPTGPSAPRHPDSMRNVVCAVEGEPGDAAVLELAADLSERLGGDPHAVSTHDHSGELLDEAIRRVADEQRAGLAVVGPPQDSRPSSWLNVPTAIALAAAGDVPVWSCPTPPTPRHQQALSATADRMPSRDNTVTTTALSTRSSSSMIAYGMRDSAVGGQDCQSVRKVEGLVVRLDRGSSNLPGRIHQRARLVPQPRCGYGRPVASGSDGCRGSAE